MTHKTKISVTTLKEVTHRYAPGDQIRDNLYPADVLTIDDVKAVGSNCRPAYTYVGGGFDYIEEVDESGRYSKVPSGNEIAVTENADTGRTTIEMSTAQAKALKAIIGHFGHVSLARLFEKEYVFGSERQPLHDELCDVRNFVTSPVWKKLPDIDPGTYTIRWDRLVEFVRSNA